MLATQQVMTVSLVVATVVLSGVSVAKPATYEGADLDRAVRILARHKPAEISRQAVSKLQEWVDAEKKGRKTQAIVNHLEGLQNEWRAASARMDRELQQVVDQARTDSVYRAWAGFFRFVATTADLAARVEAFNTKKQDAGDTASDEAGAANDRLSPRPEPREGDVMVERSGKETIYRGEDGEWRKVGMEEFIQRRIYFAPETGSSPEGARGDADGLAGSVRQGMGDTAIAFLQTLRRQAGVEPHCSDGWQGCVLVKEGGDDSWQTPEVMGEIPEGKLDRPPTEAEKGLYRAISGIMTPADAGSLAADFTPVVGEAKSFLELVTGRDPVTGEDVSRMLALAGIIPVAGPKIKAGLKLVKISGKHLKASGKLRNRYGDFFVVLKEENVSKLRKVEIDNQANIKIDIIGRGKKEFKNGYAHFTSKSGANGIAKEGGIKARKYPDGSKKVHMLKSDSNVLSRSQLDIARMVGKHKDDARAVIVTKPGNRLIDETGLKSGAIEYRFDGNVGLEEGTVIMMGK